MEKIRGKVIILGDDVDTDQILPGYAMSEPYEEIGKYAMAGLPTEDFKLNREPGCILVAGRNFGCGSSREHAPWVLEYNGINLVIAENFARIFRQNMFNCGLMAVQMDAAVIDDMFKNFAGTDATCTTDMEKFTFTISDGKTEKVYPFTVGQFDLELVKAGGWVDYADKKY